MAKIVISGYYGFYNAGDEAVLYSILQALRKELGENEIQTIVLSQDPEYTAEHFGVGAINRWNLRDIFTALKKADILISGGGSLLQDVTSARPVLYYLTIVYMAILQKKKVIFYSQGIGPVKRKINRWLVKWIVSKVDHIYVRDHASREELIQMGVVKRPIETVIDPVMGMEIPDEIKQIGAAIIQKEWNTDRAAKEPMVGVYLRKWNLSSRFFKELIQILNWLDANGWKVVFVPMHGQEDIKAAEELLDQLAFQPLFLKEKYLPEEILGITNTLDFVIGMRLHGIIMAASRGIPFIGLSYDPKLNGFVQELQAGAVFDVHHLNAQEVIGYLQEELSALDARKAELQDKKETAQAKAVIPAKTIAKILGKSSI